MNLKLPHSVTYPPPLSELLTLVAFWLMLTSRSSSLFTVPSSLCGLSQKTCFDGPHKEGFSFEFVIGDLQVAPICDRSGGYESGCKAAGGKYETCERTDGDVIDVTTLAPLGKD